MTLIEFGQRFLNYKAQVMIVNNSTGKTEFRGMFMDCPYRFLRFSDIVRIELDNEDREIVFYVGCNSSMYYAEKPHFNPAKWLEAAAD